MTSASREARSALSAAVAPPAQARHVLKRVDVRSVVRLSLFFYLTLLVVFLVMGIVLYAIAGAAGLVGGTERFIQSLFGFTSFRFAPVRLFLGLLVTGVVLSLFGTLFNAIAAVVFNLIADASGGIGVVVEERPAAHRPRPLV